MPGETRTIAVADIQIVPGLNPRRYFDETALEALTESVRRNGIVQPVVVRPAVNEPALYELAAGERRVRAARAAGLAEIPALVRDMDDCEMLVISTVENHDREDISFAEEARLSRRAVARSEGDRDAAARLLGWSRHKIDARMALLHANDSVLEALEHKRIHYGIAEVLAGVPPESQDATLETALERGASVDALRDLVRDISQELARARFDTSDCDGCPMNSSTQRSLFTHALESGRCSNRTCWNDKTEAHIQAMRAHAAEQYAAVYLDRECDESGYTPLVAEGPQGVGQAQLDACRGCQFHGALISTAPGRAGATTTGMCFNLACHRQKVADLTAAHVDTESASASHAASAPPSKPRKESQPQTVAGAPRAVRDAARQTLRAAALEQVDDPVVSQCIKLYGLMKTATARRAALAALDIDGLVPVDHKVFQKLIDATPAQRDAVNHALLDALLCAQGNEYDVEWLNIARRVVAHRDVELAGRQSIDKAFLKAHTKAGIADLMAQAGFDVWYDAEQGAGAFKKLNAGKVDDQIDTITASGFDFSALVPRVLRQQASPDA